MSEENKQPLPEDVPQTPPASPAQPEESIAALEREARAKREAELNEQQEDKEVNPVQPAVNKLKKRKRGKATAFLAILAVVLIFGAWGGNWVYRNLIWQPKEEKKAADSGQTNKTDYRQRTNMGQDNDTGEAPAQMGSNPASGATGGQVAPPVPTVLNKAQFLVRPENSGGATQGAVKTRREEMTMKASQSTAQADDSSPPGSPDKVSGPTPKQAEPVRRIPYNPDLYVPENTAIPCSLDYRFVSDRAGKIRCTITKDIWSASGNTRLIEKGTGATGLYATGAEDGMKHGQGRAFIIITKLRTRQAPFLDIPLIDTNAAGELGEAGVDGWIDTHFGERFGGALMVGMIPDIGAWASNSAGKKDRNTDYTENSRQAMAEMAKTTLENSINIPPTLYKNQGEIINLITGQDIDFSNIYTLKMKGNPQ